MLFGMVTLFPLFAVAKVTNMGIAFINTTTTSAQINNIDPTKPSGGSNLWGPEGENQPFQVNPGGKEHVDITHDWWEVGNVKFDVVWNGNTCKVLANYSASNYTLALVSKKKDCFFLERSHTHKRTSGFTINIHG